MWNGEKNFEDAASTFAPKTKTVKAFRHKGEPEQYPVKDGTETAYDGYYVVQVGIIEKTEYVPPKDGKPGFSRVHKEPLLEVMKADDFESLYIPTKGDK